MERADTVQHDSDHWPIRTDMKLLTETLERDLVVPNIANAPKSHVKLATAAFSHLNAKRQYVCAAAYTLTPTILESGVRIYVPGTKKKRLVSKSLKLGHCCRV